MLVTPDVLHRELQSPQPPLLLDVRPAEEFAAGHLAGGLFMAS